jgi:hypothetical protein
MGTVIHFDPRKRHASDAFIAEFLAFAHGEAGCRRVTEAQVRAVARYAFGASRGGADWLAMEPENLLLASMPEEWSRAALTTSESLALTFVCFLVATKRVMAPAAAVMELGVCSARLLLLDVVLEEEDLECS